jgi:hypothetical protein
MPQNPKKNSEWESHTSDDKKDITEYLGNLFLINAEKNKRYGNDELKIKKEKIKKDWEDSTLPRHFVFFDSKKYNNKNTKIFDIELWSESDIRNRSNLLLEIYENNWEF